MTSPGLEQIVTLDACPEGEELLTMRYGAGDAVFLAWHGLSANSRLWFWDALWPHGSVELFGLPGHGAVRTYPPLHYRRWNADYFIALGEQIARLYAGRPLTLIGHSTGGMVALGVAQAAPELVSRLVLISPVVWGQFGGLVGTWARLRRWPRLLNLAVTATLAPGRRSRRWYRHALRAFASDWRGLLRNPNLERALDGGYHHAQQTTSQAIGATMQVIAAADLRPSVLARPYAGPTLLIHGTRDRIVPAVQSRWLAAHLPQAHLALVPGAGHLPYAERELLVNQWLLSFIQRYPTA